MASSSDDATNIGELDPSIPADNMLVQDIAAEIRLVKSVLSTDLASIGGVVTSNHTELNILDGVSVTGSELDALAGTTVTSSDISKLTDITVAALDINASALKLDPVIKTTGFIANANSRYRVDTSSASFVVTLPAGVDGAGVAVVDVSGSCSTAKYARMTPQSGEKLLGVVDDYLDVDVRFAAVHLAFDSTYGWTFA